MDVFTLAVCELLPLPEQPTKPSAIASVTTGDTKLRKGDILAPDNFVRNAQCEMSTLP